MYGVSTGIVDFAIGVLVVVLCHVGLAVGRVESTFQVAVSPTPGLSGENEIYRLRVFIKVSK